MILDCIMLRDELDMLECRLRTMEPWDVTHVITEAEVTHRGDPKPLNFLTEEALHRFWPWRDRIIYVSAAAEVLNGGAVSAWDREHNQREAARGIIDSRAAPGDVVLLADVDEIPSASFLDEGLPTMEQPAVALRQRLAMYAVDWLYPENHICSVAVLAGVLHPHISLPAVRDARYSFPVVEDAGWHLTWLGGVDEQRRKLSVHCHAEMTAEEAERISSGAAYVAGAHHGGGVTMVAAEVDASWPAWIYERKCPASWFRPREGQ